MTAIRGTLRRAGAGLWAICLILLTQASAAARSDTDEDVWAALRTGGHVVLVRHALAPGIGDPDHFRVDDCTTQRNLSDSGREQARAIGARLREQGIAGATIYSSQWCRCLDTARLLGLGDVTPFPGLNSLFRRSSEEARQSEAVRELIRNQASPDKTLVLVTHQVNITALTGVYPQSGEMVVLRPDGDGLLEIGRIR